MSRSLRTTLPVIFIVLACAGTVSPAHAFVPDSDTPSHTPETSQPSDPSVNASDQSTPSDAVPSMANAARALASQYARGTYQWKYWTTIAHQHEGNRLNVNPLLVETE
jgi:hypothetical protein